MVRSEKNWWWLPAFCWGSLFLHLIGLFVWKDMQLFRVAPPRVQPKEIVVDLQPIKTMQPQNLFKPKDAPALKVEEVKVAEKKPEEVKPDPVKPDPKPEQPKVEPVKQPKLVLIPQPTPDQPKPEPTKTPEPVKPANPVVANTPAPETATLRPNTPNTNTPSIVRNNATSQPVAPSVPNQPTPNRVPTPDNPNPTVSANQPITPNITNNAPRNTSVATNNNPTPDLLTPSESLNPIIDDNKTQSSNTFVLRPRTGPTPVVAPTRTTNNTRSTVNNVPDSPNVNLSADNPTPRSVAVTSRNVTTNAATPSLESTPDATPNAFNRPTNSVPDQIRTAATRAANPQAVASAPRVQQRRATADPDQPRPGSDSFAANVAPRPILAPRSGNSYTRVAINNALKGEDTPEENPVQNPARAGARNPEQTVVFRNNTPTRGAVQARTPAWFTPRSGGAGKGAEQPGTGGQGEFRVAAISAPRVGGGKSNAGANPLASAVAQDDNPRTPGIQVGSGSVPTLGSLQRERGQIVQAGSRKVQQSRTVGGNNNPSTLPETVDKGAFGAIAKNTVIPRQGGKRGDGANALAGATSPEENPVQGFARSVANEAVPIKRGSVETKIAQSASRGLVPRSARTDNGAPLVANLQEQQRLAQANIRQNNGALKSSQSNPILDTSEDSNPATANTNSPAIQAANLGGTRSNSKVAGTIQRANGQRARQNGGEVPDAGNRQASGPVRVTDANVKTGSAVRKTNDANALGSDESDGNPNAATSNSPSASAANLGGFAENSNQKVAKGNAAKPTSTRRNTEPNGDGPQVKTLGGGASGGKIAANAAPDLSIGAAKSNQSLTSLLITGDGPKSTVFVLDVSKSMTDGNKIGIAKESLKEALRQHGPGEYFNIVTFSGTVKAYKFGMQEATPANVAEACKFVDSIQLGPFTDLSDALLQALKNKDAKAIILLSDGDPNGGENDSEKLRAMVRTANSKKIKINTLALGLAGAFEATVLLQGIAADNNGEFSKVDLAQIN